MRRSHVDDGRYRQALAERRFRGHRIRGGLDDLGDLDAPQRCRERKESAAALTETRGKSSADLTATVTGTSMSTAEETNDVHIGAPGIFSTVFGADWSEWTEVKRLLFDMTATAAAKRRALGLIHIWRQRTRKERQLPAYVESTEVLMDSMLQDEEGALGDMPLRMCYGAAILRAVHIMTGSFAVGTADTYRKRASEIGFPEEAVEVRQRVAHGVLPSVSELRWVCGLVLQFLFTKYWLEQERQVYLMQQERGASSLGGPSNTVPGRMFGSSSATTPATDPSAPATSPPPPSFTPDEIRALLHDLDRSEAEDDEGDRKGGVAEGGEKTASITASPSVAAAAQANECSATLSMSSGSIITEISGWRVS